MKQFFILLLISSASVYGQEQAPKNMAYTDTLGNTITQESFKELMKSGKYLAAYRTEGENVTYFLMNKKKAEKEAAERMQKTRDKFINSSLPDFKLKKMDGTE